MTEKEEIIKKIIEFPVQYGKIRDVVEEGKWDENKLLHTELYILKNFLRDIITLERNRKEIYGQ